MAPSPNIIHSEIGLLIARLARAWRREVDQALADQGLSQATALPLMVLSLISILATIALLPPDASEPLYMQRIPERKAARTMLGMRYAWGVLAEEMGIEGPSLVRLIDLLQAEGLVERREDPTDRRAKTLHLTATGEAKVAETNRVLSRVRADLLKDIAADDLAATFDALQRIEQRANRIGQQRSAAEEP